MAARTTSTRCWRASATSALGKKCFYQKVRDLFALAADYDKTDQATQQFFATV
jgi:hypothetical protein